jgi:hypothetical protein
MAKNGFGFGAFNWLVVLAAVLALIYYLYEGGRFSEGAKAWGARTDRELHKLKRLRFSKTGKNDGQWFGTSQAMCADGRPVPRYPTRCDACRSCGPCPSWMNPTMCDVLGWVAEFPL